MPVSLSPWSTDSTSVLTLVARALSSGSAKSAVTRCEKSPATAASTTWPKLCCSRVSIWACASARSVRSRSVAPDCALASAASARTFSDSLSSVLVSFSVVIVSHTSAPASATRITAWVSTRPRVPSP